jgi:phosphoserine phosphatase RsbU/P
MRHNPAVRPQFLGGISAAAWLLLVLAVELATHNPAFVPSTLYALSPLIACAVFPASVTTLFGLAALLLTVVSSSWNNSFGTQQMWVRVVDVALVSGAAITLSAIRTQRDQQVARITRLAEVAQRTILPRVPARIGPIVASVRYVSAAEDALVGGDLYDWFHSEQRICFIVGDVRGKGVDAVEQAARVIRAFRQFVAIEPHLAMAAQRMSAYLAPFMDEEEFATATLVQVHRRHVTLVDCGHPTPLLVRGTGEARLLDPPVCLPLGIGQVYESMDAEWGPGDRLFLYTDGLSEARNSEDDYLPVVPLAPRLRAADLEASLDDVIDAVLRHVPRGHFTDDLAVLLLENAYGATVREADLHDSGIPTRAPISLTEASAGYRKNPAREASSSQRRAAKPPQP